MTGQPPHPDEDDLVRFHNGDTLSNIPIVQLPQSDEPPSWRRVPLIAVAVLGAAVIGGLAAVGVLTLVDGGFVDSGSRTGGCRVGAGSGCSSAVYGR
ncbi:hypothetical protein [Streptomyces sp. NBC_00483]|uniref:hypothetical protein n=1 Tax=Streptomyces sp. NBC_00483 TaxID=2975756 RepID=UPI002E18C2B7